ncbi:3-demethylubiquinone-9 3-methyltransferase [Pandoraea captiosa]|uniref:3-demethylubiquinone-9 3-methyltransferase n=1 Tax=Pandoraea captiosa TaxID=2508302 RepID=A0A5E5AJG8_9BURK|nr:VOC family protein [Pandoraea captiosa]VVE72952.1 3-demethylubiquinone-9 3-methyltransferase [Pandoraea captiosa]
MQVHSYLFFEGRCEEAIDFYVKTLGAKPGMLMRYGESPESCPEGMLPPGSENKIMHGEFFIGESMVMASDGMASGKPKFEGFALSVDFTEVAAAEKAFRALAEGGEINMPLGETFFAKTFGMVKDRFGMNWMVIVPKEMPKG